MENSSWVSRFFSNVSEKLLEQSWFLELKGKWEELDAQSRFYLKTVSGVAAALAVLGLLVTSIYSVYSKKSEYKAKSELLLMLQSANEELRSLRESTSGTAGATAATGNWKQYFETTAESLGLDKANIAVSPEKPGASTDTIKEELIDVSLNHVNIKQIVNYTFNLESGTRPVKLRNLTIDTKSDPSGYMNATLALSGFAMITK